MNSNFLSRTKIAKLLLMAIAMIIAPATVLAEGPPKISEMSHPLAQILMVVIVGLLIAIAMLAYVLLGAAELQMQKIREEKKKPKNTGTIAMIAFLCLLGTVSFAADDPATAKLAQENFGGLTATSFYTLISVIGVELVILIGLLYQLQVLLRKEPVLSTVVSEEIKTTSILHKWWTKMNRFKPVQDEAQIDLGHDYDGIRELDNRLPPWWLYGFYITIIFAGIYLWRYHVSHTAPSSKEELAIAVQQAEIEKEAYLAKTANQVDENTVTYLNDPVALDAGKKLFTTACAACHLSDGGGLVGPNLTDAYWLHGGSISDIFKTLKYGWPEKGMKSWKDDYSPIQLAQLASYVKSLQGTKPATPKNSEGTLFEDSIPVSDSTKKASNP